MSDIKFSCPHCAQHISCDSGWSGQTVACPSCQQSVVVPQLGLAIAPTAAPPPPLPTAVPPAPQPQPQLEKRPWSGLAIASIILCFGFGPIGWIASIICGHMAKTRIAMNPKLRGNGLATTGLAVSYSFLCLLLFGIGLAFYFKDQRQKELAQQKQEWAAREAQRQAGQAQRDADFQKAVAENRVPFKEPKLEMPTNAVAGLVGGQRFTYEHAIASQGSFLLREGKNLRPERAITIRTLVSPTDLAGKTLLVTPETRNARLQVTAEWLDAANKTQRNWATRGYYLKVSFGPIENKRMNGSIELRMPGAPATSIKGDFVAAVN